MVRALVLYDEEPEPTRYAEHVALCRQGARRDLPARQGVRRPDGRAGASLLRRVRVAGPGRVQGSGELTEFAATGKDAMAMGKRLSVEFAELTDG